MERMGRLLRGTCTGSVWVREGCRRVRARLVWTDRQRESGEKTVKESMRSKNYFLLPLSIAIFTFKERITGSVNLPWHVLYI